jgi:hypothetical protein
MDLIEIFPVHLGETVVDGLVKLKLAHAEGFSLVLPDTVFADIDGWKWFQPHYFTACQISFVGDAAYGQLGVDTDTNARLLIGFTKDRLVCRYADGSHLYQCRITGPADLATRVTGTCVRRGGKDICLQLFHHTTPDSIRKILSCGHFRGSRWNMQGNKQLENVQYVYFTSMARIRSKADLEQIAMASDGRLHLLPTNGVAPRDVVEIAVYRENTFNRRSTLPILVPVEIVAPQHVWRHEPVGQAVYYETSHPAIFRVGLQPGAVLPFAGREAIPADHLLKRFEYVVLGDANVPVGLAAPYDEEHTDAIFKIEKCVVDGDIFDFWRTHANSDQFSARRVDLQTFEEK